MSAISFIEAHKAYAQMIEDDIVSSLKWVEGMPDSPAAKKEWHLLMSKAYYYEKLEAELKMAYMSVAMEDPIDLEWLGKQVEWSVEEMHKAPEFMVRLYELHAFEVMALAKEAPVRDPDAVTDADPNRYYERLLWRFNNHDRKICQKKKARKAR